MNKLRLEFTITKLDAHEWEAEAKQKFNERPPRSRVWRGRGTTAWTALLEALYEAEGAGWIK